MIIINRALPGTAGTEIQLDYLHTNDGNIFSDFPLHTVRHVALQHGDLFVTIDYCDVTA